MFDFEHSTGIPSSMDSTDIEFDNIDFVYRTIASKRLFEIHLKNGESDGLSSLLLSDYLWSLSAASSMDRPGSLYHLSKSCDYINWTRRKGEEKYGRWLGSQITGDCRTISCYPRQNYPGIIAFQIGGIQSLLRLALCFRTFHILKQYRLQCWTNHIPDALTRLTRYINSFYTQKGDGDAPECCRKYFGMFQRGVDSAVARRFLWWWILEPHLSGETNQSGWPLLRPASVGRKFTHRDCATVIEDAIYSRRNNSSLDCTARILSNIRHNYGFTPEVATITAVLQQGRGSHIETSNATSTGGEPTIVCY